MIRKVAAVAGAAVLVSVGAALPAHADTRSAVHGQGTLGTAYGSPTITLESEGSGTGVHGHWTISYPAQGWFAGRITCTQVAGTVAYVVGQVRVSRDPSFPVGSYVGLGVAAPAGGPVTANFSPAVTAAPACGFNPAAVPVLPLVSGSFRVRG